jgi:signal transduction histidine kinase
MWGWGKPAYDGFVRQLARLGDAGAAAVLTGLITILAVIMHIALRWLEGQTISMLGNFNLALEIAMVAMPAILYARKVINALKQSRIQQDELSRRLAVAAEEARQANRAKSAFLANMSHELRTPLNAIIGFSEIMKDQHLGPVHNPRYLGYARDIHYSGRHLLGIINDVLDLAKIEAGKMTLESAEEFEAAECVCGALAMVSGLGEKFGVAIIDNLPRDGARLMAVERMLRQVVINVAGNAIKFTPQGGSVTIDGGLMPDGAYAVTVRDTGVGMTEQEIVNALVPFGQNATEISRKHDGTGLGLPLAKAMVELHGGSLAIASRPDHGTLVTLRFPPERLAGARVAAA